MLSTRADIAETLDERKSPRPSAQGTTWPRTVAKTVEWAHGPDGEIAPGTRIGAYRIVEEIGRGGMATVYLAVRGDGELREQVAIKVMNGPYEKGLVGRFRSEQQVLAELDHPNIARFLASGRAPNGRPFLVMEYIDGLPIDEHCASRQLSVSERVELLRDVCLAVDHAHQHHVVHRDIKPQNILVTADGVVKLLDFGIAKLLPPRAPAENVDVTCAGLQPMTPGYASPEQICGDGVTALSDVYALGLLAYKLLTDRLPFGDSSGGPPRDYRGLLDWRLRRMERLVRGELPVKPSKATGRRLARDLDAIVLEALRLDPAQRYGSAAELAEDIQRYLEGKPVLARQGELFYRLAQWLRLGLPRR